MNIWIAKLGDLNFTKENKLVITELLKKEYDTQNLDTDELFEYKTPFIHYLSYQPKKGDLNKGYNYINPENKLTAYSGFLVGKTTTMNDYRSARSIHKFSHAPNQFSEKILGHFSVIHASGSEFQCFVDNFSLHKVFNFESSDNQIYITNFIELIKLFKEQRLHVEAFLDWITLESGLFRETEEKDIYTLPDYGILKWNPTDGLTTEYYTDLKDIYYNPAQEKSLIDTTVSELRACAKYLSTYHNCVIPLSGGYDSRLVLSMFWGLDRKKLDSYTLFDNSDDISIAKRVARAHSISHKELILSDELPTLEELHNYLIKEQFPFFKYSNVFEYLANKSLEKMYGDTSLVQLKGTGGNPDRRIMNHSFLDAYNEDEVFQKISDSLLDHNGFLTHEALEYMKQRIQSYYRQKYSSIISGRGKDHRLKCILSKENFIQKVSNRHTQIHAPFDNWFLPLMIDSFQMINFKFSNDKSKLIRGQKGSIYHQLFRALTNGKDKPIHFASGLHWEASKFSRGLERFRKHHFEKFLKKRFGFREKNTHIIKREFLLRNKSEFLDILIGAKNSILWDYFDRDLVVQKLQNTTGYDDKQGQIIFQRIIPFLKIEDGFFKKF